ncbi:NAD(P)-binding protein [Schizopora paradoxa]|uniref:NAD(P)-binding protein n=1 Tax=Schizopora paradoxa TaxID=27342 RepID=A0A0H2RFT3_9AGAM|nr:NAD(P)-binding protein [Schizopora paradoxa]
MRSKKHPLDSGGMSSTSPLVLITGATGFVGSHVVHQAISAGYPVRLVTRPGKDGALCSLYDASKNVDVVVIEDIASSDFTEALRGVGAVIHVASPNAGRSSPEGMISGAVNGTLNIVKQATAAGVKRIVVTSSLTALADITSDFYARRTHADTDWNEVTKESVLDGTHENDALCVYSASKAIAERELWKFADAHPEVDITTILPCMVYGPIAPGIKLTKEGLANYSTAAWFYQALLPPAGQQAKLKPVQDTVPMTVDVRDVARAHVLALSAAESSSVRRKRLLVAGETFLFKDAVEHLAKVRPELRDRLPDTSEAKPLLEQVNIMDTSRTKEVLGITEFIDWRKTVEDSVQSFLDIEKSWGETN